MFVTSHVFITHLCASNILRVFGLFPLCNNVFRGGFKQADPFYPEGPFLPTVRCAVPMPWVGRDPKDHCVPTPCHVNETGCWGSQCAPIISLEQITFGNFDLVLSVFSVKLAMWHWFKDRFILGF